MQSPIPRPSSRRGLMAQPEPPLMAPIVREIIEQVVAAVFSVPLDELRAPTRRRARTALARQAAMYLAHVGCGINLTAVGLLFGRDRTTVAHACGRIEDRRDDPDFDRSMEYLEAAIRRLLPVSRQLRGHC